MKLTNGDGIARLVEASGASQMLNISSSLLRKVSPFVYNDKINDKQLKPLNVINSATLIFDSIDPK